jgi:hypothetical protein
VVSCRGSGSSERRGRLGAVVGDTAGSFHLFGPFLPTSQPLCDVFFSQRTTGIIQVKFVSLLMFTRTIMTLFVDFQIV